VATYGNQNRSSFRPSSLTRSAILHDRELTNTIELGIVSIRAVRAAEAAGAQLAAYFTFPMPLFEYFTQQTTQAIVVAELFFALMDRFAIPWALSCFKRSIIPTWCAVASATAKLRAR
jgi:hypothetical protein